MSPTPAKAPRTPKPAKHAASAAQPARHTSVGSDSARRDRMIATAAYYRAERRGFAPGAELEDWLAAEAEIDREP